MTDVEQAVELALDAIDLAWREAVAAIDSAEPDEGLRASKKLSDAVQGLPPRTARVHARQAQRVWETLEDQALGPLSEKAGVSRERARQLLKKAKQDREAAV